MTDKELQRLEHDTLDESDGVMYRASLLHTGLTEDEYLKHLNDAVAQQFMYEQLDGPVGAEERRVGRPWPPGLTWPQAMSVARDPRFTFEDRRRKDRGHDR